MPDITFTADTSKLRAELRLAQEELRKLTAAETAAVKAGDAPEVYKASAARETQLRQVRALNAEYNKLNKTTTEHNDSLKEFIHSGRGLGRVVSEFSNLSRGAESLTGILGVLTGGFVGGLAGVAVARAFDFLLGKLDEVQKRIEAVQTQAGNLGVKPIAAQALGEAGGAAGVKPEEVIAATQKMSDKIDEARNKMGQLGAAGVTVFQGSMVDGVERAKNSVLDLSKGLDGLNIVMRRFPGTEEGKLQAIIERYKTFVTVMKTLDTQQQNIFSKGETGFPATKGLEIADAVIKNLTKSLDELKEAPRAVTPPVEDMAKKLKEAANGSTKAWNDVWSVLDKNSAQQNINMEKLSAGVAQFVLDILKLSEQIGKAWEANKPAFLKPETWTTALSEIRQTLNGFFDWIIAKWNVVAEAASAALKQSKPTPGSGSPEPSFVGVTGASGGLLRGPGTGTSDSIMARLSNGEFVMRAAAVRHWGADMMQALNAAGSDLLPRSTRRRGFAAGGMVTATTSDGVTVNLHFPGGNFSLHGDKAIVAGLTREARRAGMLSASRMPAFA